MPLLQHIHELAIILILEENNDTVAGLCAHKRINLELQRPEQRPPNLLGPVANQAERPDRHGLQATHRIILGHENESLDQLVPALEQALGRAAGQLTNTRVLVAETLEIDCEQLVGHDADGVDCAQRLCNN